MSSRSTKRARVEPVEPRIEEESTDEEGDMQDASANEWEDSEEENVNSQHGTQTNNTSKKKKNLVHLGNITELHDVESLKKILEQNVEENNILTHGSKQLSKYIETAIAFKEEITKLDKTYTQIQSTVVSTIFRNRLLPHVRRYSENLNFEALKSYLEKEERKIEEQLYTKMGFTWDTDPADVKYFKPYLEIIDDLRHKYMQLGIPFRPPADYIGDHADSDSNTYSFKENSIFWVPLSTVIEKMSAHYNYKYSDEIATGENGVVHRWVDESQLGKRFTISKMVIYECTSELERKHIKNCRAMNQTKKFDREIAFHNHFYDRGLTTIKLIKSFKIDIHGKVDDSEDARLYNFDYSIGIMLMTEMIGLDAFITYYKRKFDFTRDIAICLDLRQTLDELHRMNIRGIFHGDLQFRNIGIDIHDKRTFLLDFGESRFLPMEGKLEEIKVSGMYLHLLDNGQWEKKQDLPTLTKAQRGTEYFPMLHSLMRFITTKDGNIVEIPIVDRAELKVDMVKFVKKIVRKIQATFKRVPTEYNEELGTYVRSGVTMIISWSILVYWLEKKRPAKKDVVEVLTKVKKIYNLLVNGGRYIGSSSRQSKGKEFMNIKAGFGIQHDKDDEIGFYFPKNKKSYVLNEHDSTPRDIYGHHAFVEDSRLQAEQPAINLESTEREAFLSHKNLEASHFEVTTAESEYHESNTIGELLGLGNRTELEDWMWEYLPFVDMLKIVGEITGRTEKTGQRIDHFIGRTMVLKKDSHRLAVVATNVVAKRYLLAFESKMSTFIESVLYFKLEWDKSSDYKTITEFDQYDVINYLGQFLQLFLEEVNYNVNDNEESKFISNNQQSQLRSGFTPPQRLDLKEDFVIFLAQEEQKREEEEKKARLKKQPVSGPGMKTRSQTNARRRGRISKYNQPYRR